MQEYTMPVVCSKFNKKKDEILPWLLNSQMLS